MYKQNVLMLLEYLTYDRIYSLKPVLFVLLKQIFLRLVVELPYEIFQPN